MPLGGFEIQPQIEQADVVAIPSARHGVGRFALTVQRHDLLGGRDKIVHAQAHALVAQARIERGALVELPLALGKQCGAAHAIVGVAPCFGKSLVDHAARGQAQIAVKNGLAGVKTLVIPVQSVAQIEVAKLFGQGGLEAKDIGVLMGGRDIGAGIGREVQVFLAVEGLQIQVLPAQHIACAVVGVEHEALGHGHDIALETLALLQQLRAAKNTRQIGPGVQITAAVELVAVVLARQAQVLLRAQLELQIAQHIHAARVLQIGLGDIGANLVALGVIEITGILHRNAQPPLHGFVAARNRLGQSPLMVSAARKAAGQSHFAAVARGAVSGLLGDDVHNAARCAAAIQGAGAGKHLNALDVESVDGIQLPRRGAGGVEGDAINHHQHGAATQVLAEGTAPLVAQVNARHQMAQRFLQIQPGLHLRLQLRTVDDLDGGGELATVLCQPRAADSLRGQLCFCY